MLEENELDEYESEENELEENEKSEIVNEVYMNRCLEVINNIVDSKKIINSRGVGMQFSDRRDSVNIYNKGDCYIVNFADTNFYTLIGMRDGAYLYKNKGLDIDYKLHEVILAKDIIKRVASYSIKDVKVNVVYLDKEGDLSLIYKKISSDDKPEYTIYDENLVNLSDKELLEKITNSVDKLPQRIEDFDFSKYGKEDKRLKIGAYIFEIGEDFIEDMYDVEDELDILEEFEEIEDELYEDELDYLESEKKRYKNIKIFIDGEELEEDEKVKYAMILNMDLEKEDENFFDIVDTVNDIVSIYETELNRFDQEPSNETNEINEKIEKNEANEKDKSNKENKLSQDLKSNNNIQSSQER